MEPDRIEQASIDLDSKAVRHVTKRLIGLGVPFEIDGTIVSVHARQHELLVAVASAAMLDDAVRGSSQQGPVRRGSTCPECGQGQMIDERCQTCYWSPNDHDDGAGAKPSVEARRLDRQLSRGVAVDACYVLGGSGVPLLAGTESALLFDEQHLRIVDPSLTHDLWVMDLTDVNNIWIGGSGAVTSDAGIVGGGTGATNIAYGMALAWAINRITRRTTVTTLLVVTFHGGELFFLHGRYGPQTLRLLLSPVYSKLGLSDPTLAERDGGHASSAAGFLFLS